MVGRDEFFAAVRRVAAKDPLGFADPDEVASELGISAGEVTTLIRRYHTHFQWHGIPVGKIKLLLT